MNGPPAEEPRRRPRRSRVGAVTAGILFGSVGIWLAVRGLALADLARGFDRVDWTPAVAAVLTTVGTLLLGAARWQLLFYPDHRRMAFSRLFRGLVVGQMLNIVSPVRVGEVSRIWAVAGLEGVSKARVLATIALEKILDLSTFALAVFVVLALVALPPVLRVRQDVLWIAAVAGAATLWAVARRPRWCSFVFGWVVRALPAAWQGGVTRAADGFVGGLSALRTSRAWLPAVLLSLALVFLAVLTNYLLFLALGLDLPVLAALLLLVVLQAGSVPPALPGRIGVFHYLTIVALAVFDVERPLALSYSIALYVAAYLPRILLGVACLATGRHGFRAEAVQIRR